MARTRAASAWNPKRGQAWSDHRTVLKPPLHLRRGPTDALTEAGIGREEEVWHPDEMRLGLRCVVWDGAPVHRARVMQEQTTVRIRPPAYSPELNSAERVFEEVWRWAKGIV